MSIISKAMVEKGVAATDGLCEAHEMRAALESVAPDIIDACARECELMDTGFSELHALSFAKAIRALKSKT